MERKYLLGCENFKDFTSISNNIEDKIIQESIYLAQTLDLRPVIGSKLYNYFINNVEKLNDGTMDSEYITLYFNYIFDTLLSSAKLRLITGLLVRYSNVNIGTKNDENSNVIDVNLLNDTKNDLISIQKIYLSDLSRYLCEKYTLFIDNLDDYKISEYRPKLDLQSSNNMCFMFKKSKCNDDLRFKN